MAKNLLLEYSEELATKCELLCKSISGNSNTIFQLRKSSSSVFANITEAQYPQSLADIPVSIFCIAPDLLKEPLAWGIALGIMLFFGLVGYGLFVRP